MCRGRMQNGSANYWPVSRRNRSAMRSAPVDTRLKRRSNSPSCSKAGYQYLLTCKFRGVSELQLIELRIQASGLQQLLVVAALDNCSVLYHKDDVCPANGGEAGREYDGRLNPHQAGERLEDQPLRLRVVTRTWVVE